MTDRHDQRVQEAAHEMAEVIVEALKDYGEEFSLDDLEEIADLTLALIPVQALALVIALRLMAYGHDQEHSVSPGSFSHDPVSVATWARIAWAQILPDVDALLPTVDGKRKAINPIKGAA